jgi:hypothetical protein
MDPISIEDLALLEVLRRVDQCMPMQSGDTEIHQRLIDSGLAVEEADLTRLTLAGVEMCKSLQHRVAADAQVARQEQQRKANGASHDADDGAAAVRTD